jgi:hypothetical protein
MAEGRSSFVFGDARFASTAPVAKRKWSDSHD